ncbi:MAG: pyrroline-5-carboxylate reductase [Clostridia bacterium]|nr:pyrroline-5-carboxylate reductase [Clostridia bacterium]
MKKYSFGFIGCGHMGATLVNAVAKIVNPATIAVCDRDERKTEALAKTLGVAVTTAEELVKNSKFVVLGVKPQNMEETLIPLRAAFAENDEVSVITMAAGVEITKIRALANGDFPVVRIMPNTPCEVGEGTILYALSNVGEKEKTIFEKAFSACGLLVPVKEEEIDAAGALSGCGPAFFYLYAQGLADGAAALGMDGKTAVTLAAQTMLGAAKMLLKHGDAQKLCEEVCSPGGTTIEGVKTLREQGVPAAAKAAVNASFERTLQLKK